MKVLVTGAKGQLGQEIVRVFEKTSLVVATDTDTMDITGSGQVRTVVTKEKPDWIIHCAAWINVDAAAEKPAAAMKVNGQGTKNICQAAKEVGAKVLYVSTAEVFDGKKRTPYTEKDVPRSMNPYAESKLAGEIYCQKILGKRCVIARPSWLYGPTSKNNFPNKILNRFKEQGFLKVVDDEFGAPTYAPDVAEMIYELVERNASGIFHTVNKGEASRYSFAVKIFQLLGLPSNKIEPIKMEDFKRASKPPKYSGLSTEKIGELGIKPRKWEEALSDYIKILKKSSKSIHTVVKS